MHEARFSLDKLYSYANKVYGILGQFKEAPDHRQPGKCEYSAAAFLVAALSMFLLQAKSLNGFMHEKGTAQESLRQLLGLTRVPTMDALADYMSRVPPSWLDGALTKMARKARKAKMFDRNRIDGLLVAAIDGIENFSTSLKKPCSKCLTRAHNKGKPNEKTEHFHRHVVAMTVGGEQHFVLGQMMLTPREGAQKDKGETTGAKELLLRLREEQGRFADVITADALYLSAPFVKLIKDLDMELVARLKDEDRLLYKDTKPLFDKGWHREKDFKGKAPGGDVIVEVNDYKNADMTNLDGEVRVLRFVEYENVHGTKGKKLYTMWVVTTSMNLSPKTIWKIMHRRWDIELNGFHQLSVYYRAKHCFCHEAAEQFLLLALIAFNLRESYILGQRARDFRRDRRTREGVTKDFNLNLFKYGMSWTEEELRILRLETRTDAKGGRSRASPPHSA